VQRHTSPLVLGGVRLDAPVEPSSNWLYTDPDGDNIVATRATATPGPFALSLPGGRSIAAPAIGLKRIIYRPAEGEIAIECSGPPATLALTGWGERPVVKLNGEPVSIRPGAGGEWFITTQ
jgi:hypothetical protein